MPYVGVWRSVLVFRRIVLFERPERGGFIRARNPADKFAALRHALAAAWLAERFDIDEVARLNAELHRALEERAGVMDMANHQRAINAVRIAGFMLKEERELLERAAKQAAGDTTWRMARAALKFIEVLEELE
jgi:hypothetical protein